MHPSARFVRGEIVAWHSAHSNQEHRGIVCADYQDSELGHRVGVRSESHCRPYSIRAERLQRLSATGPTLSGPGRLA
jgi:hypothetical protein